MSVTIDATVSGPAANSYLASVAEATAIIDVQSPYRAAWATLVDDNDDEADTYPPRLLLRAANMLDTLFAFSGYASETTQSLQHPRADMPHPSGWVWDWNVVAQPVKVAQALLAAWLGAQTTPDPQTNAAASSQTLKGLTVGPISLDFATTSANTSSATTPLDDFLTRVIEPLLSASGLLGGGNMVRLSR